MQNRLLESAPLLRLAVCLIVGIVIANYVPLPIAVLPILAVMVVITMFLGKYENLQSIAILVCFLLVGMFLMQRHLSATDDSQSVSRLDNTKAYFLTQRGILLDRMYDSGVDGDAYAVVAAMALGDKSALTHELRDIYSVSGASHVLALSGLHLGIIYCMLWLLLPHRRWPAVSQTIILIVMWLYVLLVGMPVSVVRSAVMLTVYGLLSISHRNKMSVNALAFTAIVMLMWNPEWLFDIGFQLSFMAVLAILLFVPVFEDVFSAKYLQEHRLVRYVWGLVAVSVSAQIGVAPLLAYYFGRLSTYFLLTNFIVLPAAYIILGFSLIVLLFPSLAYILLYIVDTLNAVLFRITAIPGSSIDGFHPNVLQVVLAYVIIFCTYLLIERIKPALGWSTSR